VYGGWESRSPHSLVGVVRVACCRRAYLCKHGESPLNREHTSGAHPQHLHSAVRWGADAAWTPLPRGGAV
jgi:hypothetical protein